MSRNKLPELRPNIPTIQDAVLTSSSEKFQNKTLRPILKFQNELLLALFDVYLGKHKESFQKGSQTFKLNYIKNAVQKDRDFKNQLLGSIIGQFTLAEFDYYALDEKECKKRMVSMLVERLQSQLG